MVLGRSTVRKSDLSQTQTVPVTFQLSDAAQPMMAHALERMQKRE